MPVAAHVDRRPVNEARQISAMIEVEAAQEILIGLAFARMLGGDEAGDVFGKFGDARDRAVLEIGISDYPFGAAGRRADQRGGAAIDDNRIAWCIDRTLGLTAILRAGGRAARPSANPPRTASRKRMSPPAARRGIPDR
jgi:hypothetical protein